MTAQHDLTVHDLPVTDLALLPGNPRQGDIGAVSESMQQNGVYQPIIVNRGTHTGRPFEVIAGNHRAQAAQQLGHPTIPAVLLDVDDEAAARIALADNRTSDLADYDTDALVVMLQGLPDLAGTGYDGDDLDDLLRSLAYEDDEDEALSEDEDDPGQQYNTRTEIPHYEPSGTPPPLSALTDTSKTEDLRARIAAADGIPDDVRALLHETAHRHTRVDYRAMADYYSHAPAEVQRLMEQQALVIPDIGDAIREGYVRTSDRLRELLGDEYPDEYDPATDRTTA